jgi:hypothetical protein
MEFVRVGNVFQDDLGGVQLRGLFFFRSARFGAGILGPRYIKKKQHNQAKNRDHYRFEAFKCHTVLKFAAKIRAEGQNMKIRLKKKAFGDHPGSGG